MTASGIVTVTVRVAAPKIEIANVEFRAIDSEAGRSMHEEVAEITR